MKKIKITIEGMHCASCSENVQRSLSKVKGVNEVKVSLLTRKALIEADDSVNENELRNAISRVGYNATKFE